MQEIKRILRKKKYKQEFSEIYVDSNQQSILDPLDLFATKLLHVNLDRKIIKTLVALSLCKEFINVIPADLRYQPE